jgi:hypothetical protein
MIFLRFQHLIICILTIYMIYHQEKRKPRLQQGMFIGSILISPRRCVSAMSGFLRSGARYVPEASRCAAASGTITTTTAHVSTEMLWRVPVIDLIVRNACDICD